MAPNETELARITNLPTNTLAEVKTAANVLLQTGIKHILVTLGIHGSMFIGGSSDEGEGSENSTESITVCGAYLVESKKVIDTTGAGDCFRGAFAQAYVEGMYICMYVYDQYISF